jgi:hypothetical protein
MPEVPILQGSEGRHPLEPAIFEAEPVVRPGSDRSAFSGRVKIASNSPRRSRVSRE